MNTSATPSTTALLHLPIALARALGEAPFLLLHAGTGAGKSLLFYDPAERLTQGDAAAIRAFIGDARGRLERPVAGYVGYEWGGTSSQVQWLATPELLLVKWNSVATIDHDACTTQFHGRVLEPIETPAAHALQVDSLRASVSDEVYVQQAADIIEAIHAGKLYQANLTRKYMGQCRFEGAGIDAFAALCAVSPTTYSAYMQWEDLRIFSASPECFFRLDAGRIETRPIKGTMPRGATPSEDEESRLALLHSEKNRAENLMIVDLMRNDISKACHEVRTDTLFDITSHAQVHHMSSTISGTLAAGRDVADVLAATMPPGSMTGAPKPAAVKLCAAHEPYTRGIYSGALGWIGGDGFAEFSVVIRTFIMQGGRFEFQVGGGIVADSTPEGELQECFAKARTIGNWLGLDTAKDTERIHLYKAIDNLYVESAYTTPPDEALDKAGVMPVRLRDGRVQVYVMRPPAQRPELGAPELQLCKGTRMFFDGWWKDCPAPEAMPLEPLVITALREAEEEIFLDAQAITALVDVGDVAFASASSGKPKTMRMFVATVSDALRDTEEARWVDAEAMHGVRADHALAIRSILAIDRVRSLLG